MRFGLFYEHQLPRPWTPDAERRLLDEALDQIELADELGIDYAWEVEHHFLEEYSHSSAPEVFLAAATQRSKRIRLGHGIIQLLPHVNHPVRVAERVATLDLLSGGRVELGTGEGSSQAEVGGFGTDRDDKRRQWDLSLRALVRMMTETPFRGIDNELLSVPPRNIVPKPMQRPHPPLWCACSRREMIIEAAKRGIGALSFAFVDPEDARPWVDEYYRIIASPECVPIGHAVNPNFAVVVPFMVHHDEATAIDRGIDGAHFFGYSLGHYYGYGRHRPGVTDVWKEFQSYRKERGFARDIIHATSSPLVIRVLERSLGSIRGAIGTPAQLRDLLERYERVGVDQVIFVAQAGNNDHEHICEALELFADEVMPDFIERSERSERNKRERLAQACDEALARRVDDTAPADDKYLITPGGEPRPGRAPILTTPTTAQRRAPHRLLESTRQNILQLIERGGDEHLERVLGSRWGSRWGLQFMFTAIARRFDPEHARGFRGVIQFELQSKSNGVHVWGLHVDGEQVTAKPGASPAPAAVFRTDLARFARMVAGLEEFGRALYDETLVVEGDLEMATRFRDMFGA